MGLIEKDTFICLDCETTGLDPDKDQIIELAIARFSNGQILEQWETLIDPGTPISAESMAIHHITDAMVQGKPKIEEVLPDFLKWINGHIIVGHGIFLDLRFIASACKKALIPCDLLTHPYLDTLRMARLYGESPTNSLEKLRQHFNIGEEGAHRAMSDVIVNIEVFRYLSKYFKTTEELTERLKKPILLKAMPLGKHKGRPFSEIPIEYLRWAANKDFDQDLIFSLRREISKRQKTTGFGQAGNPFASL